MWWLIIIGAVIIIYGIETDAFEDFTDFLDDIEFINKDIDFRIPLSQFKRYYQIDPDKWKLYDFHVAYDNKYDIGFSIFGRIQYFFQRNKLEQNHIKIEFFQDLQEDLAERTEQIRKQTQSELEKIQMRIPKTEVGTQDIDRFFEEAKKQ